MKSYFLLSRQIFESAIWQDDPHILKLFIYLIGQSRYDKKPKVYPNCKIERGELVTSLQEISENNHYLKHGKIQKWSRQKVARMLEVLTKQGYILLLSDTYGTHIKLCNYEQYQDKNTYKREVSDSSGTSVERNWNECGTQLDTTKQDNTVKQGNKERAKRKMPISQSQYDSFLMDSVFLKEQSDKLKKTESEVKEKIELIKDSCLSKNKKYYDLPATLRNWFKNDFGKGDKWL